MTTHLFDKYNTRVLIYLLVAINLGQWVLLLASTLPRKLPPNSNNDLPYGQIAGAGVLSHPFSVFSRHKPLDSICAT
jgi:hypothetical protein